MSQNQHAVQDQNIYVGNKSFERLEHFSYLVTSLTNQNSFHEEIKCRLQSRNTCYYMVQNLLSYSLLSKNIKVQIYGTIILPFVLYGCDTWSPTVSEEHRLRMFRNRVLRKVFGPTRGEVMGWWGIWHNETLLWSVLIKYVGDEIKKNEMGRACSTYGEEERCIQDLGGEAWGKETTWKTQA